MRGEGVLGLLSESGGSGLEEKFCRVSAFVVVHKKHVVQVCDGVRYVGFLQYGFEVFVEFSSGVHGADGRDVQYC